MKKLFIGLLSLSILCTSVAATPQIQATQANKTASAVQKISHTKQADDKKNTSKKSSWPKGPKASSLSADSAILMDASTGLVLYEKKIHKKHYPASITKIMTSLLCLENASLGETVTFTDAQVMHLEYGASNMETRVGEKLTMEQCLYGIMLQSANEVCLGVADHIAGSTSAFADMMNQRAKELGCKNTHFTNPNGLHNAKHYTTAYDMALISRAAFQNSTFRKVTASKTAHIPATNKSKARNLLNHHQMLNGYTYPQYEYPDCIGGKTGYTSAAMSTLVTYAERDGMDLICVVMKAGSPKSNRTFNEYTDTTALLDFGFDNYRVYNMNKENTTLDTGESPLFIKFNSLFDSEKSPIQLGNDGKVILPNNVDLSKAVQSVTFDSNVPLKEGENIIGSVTYTYDGKLVGTTNIYFNKTASDELTESRPIEMVKRKTIVSETEQKSITLRIIIISIVAVLILGSLIFYIQLKIRRSKLSNRRNLYDRL